MMMNRKVLASALAAVMVCSGYMPGVMARDNSDTVTVSVVHQTGERETRMYKLSELSVEVLDEDGNPIAIPYGTSIGSHQLRANGTMYYSPAGDSLFEFSAGDVVDFSVNLDSSAKVSMGYCDSSNKKLSETTRTSSSPSVTIEIDTTGYYKLFLSNKSGRTITVEDGYISY